MLDEEEKIRKEFTNGFSKHQQRIRSGKAPNVEKALFLWFKGAVEQNLSISNALLKDKALQFSIKFNIENFQPTEGWLDGKNDTLLCTKKGTEKNKALTKQPQKSS